MGTTQDQHIRRLETVLEGFVEINACYLLGHRMFDPAFLHQRNEQGTGFFFCLQPPRFKGLPVSVAADRGLGANHHNFAFLAGCGCPLGTRLNYSDHRNAAGFCDFIQRQCCGGVTRNYQ